MKRTKTFTGCWTCRSRKVKCDEARPTCRQCRRRKVDCEGYEVRLQWLTPETGPSLTYAPESGNLNLQRRQLPIGPVAPLLRDDQIEGILRHVDALEYDPQSDRHHDGRLNIHCFGVFRLPQTPSYRSPPPQVEDYPSTTTRIPEYDDSVQTGAQVDATTIACGSQTSIVTPSLNHFGLSDLSSGGAARNLNSLRTLSPISTPDDAVTLTASLAAPDTIHDTTGPGPGDSVTLLTDLDVQRSTSPTIPVASREHPLCDEDRFLLYYYVHNVASLFCVIDTKKSPWRTVHIARVLQSIGETDVCGSTSRILAALRSCLLATSAFCLSTAHGTESSRSDNSSWATVASDHRCKAIEILQQAMRIDLDSQLRPKYKDFLATMLSMVTIDVMSGDTSNVGVHIRGAGQLIKHMMTVKTKFSTKALLLHRVYLYLRLMFQSTACGASIDPISSDAKIMQLIADAESVCDSASFEHIYSVSHGLIFLMRDTVDLVEQVSEARQQGPHLTEHLRSRSRSLENDLLDWSIDTELEPFRARLTAVEFEIVYHQSRAFHQAVIIYYSQHVQLLNYRYLRPFVSQVLESIEILEQKKASIGIMAAPLFWPAFIAASECFDSTLQARFQKWYQQVEMYGVRAALTGTTILYEVWDCGPAGSGSVTSSWSLVAQRHGHTLLLT